MLAESMLVTGSAGSASPAVVVVDRRRRWVVLGCSATTYMLNCFMWMSYSATPDISKSVLSPTEVPISDADLDWTYSASLSTVVVCMLPAAHLIKWHNYRTMLSSVCLNIAAAWFRYASVANASYALAIVSAVLLGGATAVMMPAFALLPEVWFPRQQRALATALSVQSWYAGWALGALVIPLVASDADSLELALLVQAAVTTLSLPVFMCTYAAKPPPLVGAEWASHELSVSPVETSAEEPAAHSQLSVGASLRAIAVNWQFWVHAWSYGLLAAISFTIPAITANVFADCMQPPLDFVASQSMWINFAFITSGVVGGVLIGAFTPEPIEPLVIRIAAVLCAVALGSIFALTRDGISTALGDSMTLLALLTALICVAGAAALGFFSLGLRTAARVGAPVAQEYAVGITETLSQVLAVGLTQSSVCPVGFKACTLSAALVAVALVCIARAPKATPRLLHADAAAAAHAAALHTETAS